VIEKDFSLIDLIKALFTAIVVVVIIRLGVEVLFSASGI